MPKELEESKLLEPIRFTIKFDRRIVPDNEHRVLHARMDLAYAEEFPLGSEITCYSSDYTWVIVKKELQQKGDWSLTGKASIYVECFTKEDCDQIRNNRLF